MRETIAEILASCLERLEAGASLESCLADFPMQAAELEPLLRMTQQMKPLANVRPRPTFARSARFQLENRLVRSGNDVTVQRRNRDRGPVPKFLPQRRFSLGMLQIFIAILLALAITTGGAAYAANASGPGDFLHGLDIAMENVQLNLAPDVSSKVHLRLEFAGERLAEAQAKFSENNADDGLEALNEYGTEISAVDQLIGGSAGADQEALESLLKAAHEGHKDVLISLLDKVPEQAQESIRNAIDASNAPKENPGNAPSEPGPPDDVGPPDEAGRPTDDVPHGPPEDHPGQGGPPTDTPGNGPKDPPGKP